MKKQPEQKEETVEESEEEPQPQEANQEDESPVIESMDIDERDVNGAESLQEKISKGIRDIFNGRKKEHEQEDEFLKEEEDVPVEEVQEEMLKDISSEPEMTNVPALEPEKIAVQTDDFDDLEKAIEENTKKK